MIRRPFWISWTEGGIEFGEGGEIGVETVISYTTVVPGLYKAVFTGNEQEESQFYFVDLLGTQVFCTRKLRASTAHFVHVLLNVSQCQ